MVLGATLSDDPYQSIREIKMYLGENLMSQDHWNNSLHRVAPNTVPESTPHNYCCELIIFLTGIDHHSE